MIVEYYRPVSIDEALALLSRPSPKTVPLGGGVWLSRHSKEPVAVVDLQSLGMSGITAQSDSLIIGATTTLHDLSENAVVPSVIRQAAASEGTFNLRQTGTIAGVVATADGRSILAALLMAMDTLMEWEPGNLQIPLSIWMSKRGKDNPGKLITRIVIPQNIQIAIESVARSPQDLPIVTAAICKWSNGRIRIVVGGFGSQPSVAYDDVKRSGWEKELEVLMESATDKWASGSYRKSVCITLVQRLLSEVDNSEVRS